LGKYAALAEYLRNQGDKQEVSLSFKQIEDILGFELPTSARKHRCWWANDESHVQAVEGWMGAGWVVKSVSLKNEEASFTLNPGIKLLLGERRKPSAKFVKARNFESFARKVMSKHFGVKLAPRKLPGWPKLFDMASSDGTIVGEAIFMAETGKAKAPPGKLSYITEKVWMLEKTSAETKFIVFGGDATPAKEWLRKYGKFVDKVQFYVIADNGELLRLK